MGGDHRKKFPRLCFRNICFIRWMVKNRKEVSLIIGSVGTEQMPPWLWKLNLISEETNKAPN